MAGKRNVFDLLSKPVRGIVEERGFPNPTGPQVAAIPKILSGKNILLIAPTGTGKTEAAFLPILDLYVKDPEKPLGIKILYITPLRALNRDLLDRLRWWCQRLDVKVSVRHGDTDTRERTSQSRSPPDLLITTPETLQAIMPGRVMRRHLKAVKWVIIDECHELAEDKRGSQLSLALERLRWITGRDFQVVGLSATIGSPEEVAQFIVGNGRPVEVVRVPVARGMEFSIFYPEPTTADYELAEKLYTHPEVAARLRVIRDMIEKHESVLLFTNTRPAAEVLASRLKIWDVDFPVSIHHGSLAKPARVSAEQGLKTGGLKGLICTSSLELGIDVGRVDLCIQYMSPRQVTRLLQRVGRSGHQIGRTARGVIITMDPDDTLEAMVIARRAKQESLEPVTIPFRPYDALNHQLVGLLVQKSRWYFDEILDVYGKAYPYRGMDKQDLAKVLEYMHTRYPRLAWVSFQDEVMLRPARIKALYDYYFDKLSMIPDEKQYLVIDETDDSPVGILDEAFVAEYGEPGTKFIVRGSPWKMLSIVGDKIYVRPIQDPTGAIPSWVGEEIPVPFDIAMEVGSIRRSAAASIARGAEPKAVAQRIARRYPVDEETALRAIKEVVEQVEMRLPVPSDRLITVEEWEEYVVVQASFGSLVNRTLARLLGHLLSERTGHTVGVQQDPYRVILQVGEVAGARDVADLLEELASRDVEKLAIEAAEKTGLFKRRMVHVARRFGALSKKADFSKVSLDRLEKSFEGTVIHEEAVKETLEKDMDVKNTFR
ncbi:MAG: DEAD/DEAH box helicase, partial [Candidatus Bathyarchaeia archaeon]